MGKEIHFKEVSYGLINRFIPFTASIYEVVGDDLIIKEGFMNRNTKTYRLYDLEEPKLVESLYQRIIKVGTIYLRFKDSKKMIVLKNVREPEKARQKLIKLFDSKFKDVI